MGGQSVEFDIFSLPIPVLFFHLRFELQTTIVQLFFHL